EKLILESLKNGDGLIWRRHEKPIETKFDIKFVQFCEDQISQADEVSFSESIAFVHLFFVYVSSADEYRTQIRHRISEWFGMLNKAGNSQWLIIFDSTKAKEKKNRGSVMEKIKSDFSKHQEKLIEISDTVPSSSTDVSSRFLACFLSSLDKFLANYERSYAQLKGNWESDDWSISAFVNQQFNLCRFYWNLGLYDCVLGELDKIDLLITEIIYSSTETRPTWLNSLSASGYGPSCPLLRMLMHVEGVADNVSLIELRTFLLANQILSLFYIYNSRSLKAASSTPTSSGGNENNGKSILSNDFATILLRYAHACTQKIGNENIELGVKNDDILSQAWQVLLSTDVLELCQYFIELDALQNSTGYICQLLCLKCNNLDSLYHSPPSSRTALALWIKTTVGQRNADVLGRATAEALNILRRTFVDRTDLEGSPDQGRSLEQFYEDSLLEAIKLLRIYSWEKAADGFMKKLFDCYRENGNTNEAKILYLKLLKRIFNDCRVLSLLLYYCKLGVDEYEIELKEDRELWVNVLLVLVLGSELKEDRETYGQRMLHEAEKEQEKLKKYNFAFGCPLKFPLQVLKVSDNFLSTLLTSSIKFNVTLTNAFDFSIPNCKIKAVFKKLTKIAIEPLNPSFVASLSSTDAHSRCACPTIGLLGKESNPNAILQSSIDTIEDDSIFFKAMNGTIENGNNLISLKPGKNEINFYGIAFPVGCFVLNHFEIEIAKSLTFFLHFQKEISQIATLDNIFLSVDVRKPVVKAKIVPDKLIAGIAQKIILEVTAGTTSVMKSNPLIVSFEGDSNLMEFQGSSGKWTKSISLNVPDLQPYDTEILEIFLCLSLDQMHYSAEDSLIMRRQIKVEWLDQTWLIDLSFTPIMSLKMSTTIIEQRVLFSVDIKRTDSLDFLDLCLQSAELLQHQSIAKPPIPAKLINSKLQNIAAHSLHRIVWELPPSKVDKSIPIKHLLTLKYNFEKKKNCAEGLNGIIPECAIEKDYCFEWKQELPISKAEYDICAQIIADNISLCRVDSECSLVVSLRRMSNHVDSRVIIIIDADSDYWTVNDKIAVVPVKESGVGQTSFTIIPRQIGLLPYPSVYIHQCNPDFNEKDSISDTTALGERLSSYHRLQARQFRVVAARQAAEDSTSQGNTSTTGSIRQALKERSFQRLKKLIDRD
uniref:Trafficking protein particle complex subunit 10 n=1 Tax=Panagrolaimus sp. PS1159 TaxID=55785 RepID=A0AC35GE89_9BILA